MDVDGSFHSSYGSGPSVDPDLLIAKGAMLSFSTKDDSREKSPPSSSQTVPITDYPRYTPEGHILNSTVLERISRQLSLNVLEESLPEENGESIPKSAIALPSQGLSASAFS